jgi:hypothetical protein
MACAHAVNGSVKIFKSVLPRIDIFMDVSLSGLGGVLGNYVYELAIVHKPNYCIAHWEAINILFALRVFSPFLASRNVTVWCDNKVAVSVLTSGRGIDITLHRIARNLWHFEAACDADITFSHDSSSSSSCSQTFASQF